MLARKLTPSGVKAPTVTCTYDHYVGDYGSAKEILDAGQSQGNGVYLIRLGTNYYCAECDMDGTVTGTGVGGWTMIANFIRGGAAEDRPANPVDVLTDRFPLIKALNHGGTTEYRDPTSWGTVSNAMLNQMTFSTVLWDDADDYDGGQRRLRETSHSSVIAYAKSGAGTYSSAAVRGSFTYYPADNVTAADSSNYWTFFQNQGAFWGVNVMYSAISSCTHRMWYVAYRPIDNYCGAHCSLCAPTTGTAKYRNWVK